MLPIRAPHIILPLACGFLLASTARVHASVPANDSYANPVLMTGSNPSLVATNADATLEVGEFNPRQIGGSSVWYRWVAATTGWHEVTTESEDAAHDLDTVLVLHRAGSDVAGAVRMGFSDNSGIVDQSRIVFFAQAGQDYRIAVHGHDGQTGTFRLAIGPVPAPGLRVHSVAFNPPSVDVGATAATSTATVRIQSTEPLVEAYLDLRLPETGSQVGFAYIDASSRVSGDDLDGTYEASFTVQAYRPAGAYPVTIYAWDGSQGYTWSPEAGDGVEDNYLMPAPAALNVLNTGSVDTAPPVLQSVSGLPAVVDLTAGEVEIALTAQIVDPLAGLLSGEIVLRNDDDDWEIGYIESEDLSSGTSQNGVYAFTVRFRDDLPLGTLTLEYDLRDALGNRVRYGHPGGPPVPAGIPATVQITATTPTNDAFANAITIEPAVTPVIQGSTRFASRETDEPSLGPQAGGSVWYRWTPASFGWHRLQVYSENQDQVVGLFNGTTLLGLQERGRSDGSITDNEWVRSPLTFYVQAGVTYHIAVCANSSFSNGAPFELEVDALPTLMPPLTVIDAFFVSGSIDVASGSRNVAVRAEIITETPFLTDFSGPGWLQMSLRPDPAYYDGPPVTAFISNSNRISGDHTFGVYEATFTLPPFIPPGPWDLVIEAGLDGTDRQVWTLPGSNPVADANIIPGILGASVRLQVNNSGIVDTEPPVLASFSGLPASINLSGGAVDTTFDFTITDTGGGFSSGSILLISTGAGGIYVIGQIGESNRISGDAFNGSYRIPYTFAETIPPGEYRLSIGLNDLAGYSSSYGPDFLQTPFPDGANARVSIVNVNTGYAGWAAGQDFGPFNLSEPTDDPNGDGISNLLCYAFNLPPNGPPARPLRPGQDDLSGLPAVSVTGEGVNRRLRIEFLRRVTPGSNLSYATQFGAHPGPGGLQDGQGTIFAQFINPDWQRVIVEDPVAGAERRFGRVRVALDE